jgi:p-hydroxybenzoate 3-monooxygenase
MRTTVAIVGAGPAGLLLSHLLDREGIESVVLESRSREYCEQRQRAGLLEQGTVDVLRASGAGERMDKEGLVHGGIELRFNREGHRIDMLGLCGRSVMIYAQTEIVKDLIGLRLAAGGKLLFEAEALAVEGADTDDPVVRYRHEGEERTLAADVVVGADGNYGIARNAIPPSVLRTYGREYPYGWLGITALAPPSSDELIYACHERGFALQSMRSTSVSRLYLQVSPDERLEDWPDERIWEELSARFAMPGFELGRGLVTERLITPHRSFVAEPMRYGRLFLAGDAAHIVPATGAKGLNLAVSDVTLLAEALTAWHQTNDTALLDAYSDTALRRVWRATHFSYFMTTLLHLDPDGDEFAHRLQLAHLDYIARSTAAATSLAENYSGLPRV